MIKKIAALVNDIAQSMELAKAYRKGDRPVNQRVATAKS